MSDVDARPVKGQHRTSLDEIEWVEGTGGRFAAYPLGDGEHDPIVVIVEYDAGMVIGPHHHGSDYFSLVLKGDIEITRRPEEVGSVRHVRANTAYGPLVVGPEGCTVLEVFQDRVAFVEPVFVGARAVEGATLSSPMKGLLAIAIAQAQAHLGGKDPVEAGRGAD